jgi:hypothetical protein
VDNFRGVGRLSVDNYLTVCKVSPLPCGTWSLWLRSVVGASAVAAVVCEPEVGTVVWCAALADWNDVIDTVCPSCSWLDGVVYDSSA